MYAYLTFITLTTLIRITFGCAHYHDPACQDVQPIDGDHFMNQFIVEIEGGEEVAKKVALDIGFKYKKPMKTHKNHYFFTHVEVYDRHKNRHEDVLKILRKHDNVKVADQQYVWRPTISELESYEDMVGLEEPLEVTTSHFHPDEIEIEGRSAWELVRPDDVFVEPEPIQNYPPIHTLVDFDKLYAEKNREKEKRAQERRLQEELEKKLEAERRAAATSVTSDSETVPLSQDEKTDRVEPQLVLPLPQDEKTDRVEEPQSVVPLPQDEKTDRIEKPQSVVDEKVVGNQKIDEDNKSEKGPQEEFDNKEKPDSVDDKIIVENKKIDANEKLKGVDDKILKTDITDKEDKLKSGDETLSETPNVDKEKCEPKFEGKITEEPGTDETSTEEADDDVTVESFEEY